MENIKEVERLCPNSKIIIWEAKDAESLCSPKELEKFRNFRYWIQQADFLRLLVLRRHGGLYLDMDAKMIKSIEPLLEECDKNQKYLFVATGLGRYTSFLPFVRNWLLYSPINIKDNVFGKMVDECLKQKERRPMEFRSWYIARSTGSVLLSRLVRENKDSALYLGENTTAKEYIENAYDSSWSKGFLDKKDWMIVVFVLLVFLLVLLTKIGNR